MGTKLVIGSSGQIGVELIEQLSKIHGPNNVIGPLEPKAAAAVPCS